LRLRRITLRTGAATPSCSNHRLRRFCNRLTPVQVPQSDRLLIVFARVWAESGACCGRVQPRGTEEGVVGVGGADWRRPVSPPPPLPVPSSRGSAPSTPPGASPPGPPAAVCVCGLVGAGRAVPRAPGGTTVPSVERCPRVDGPAAARGGQGMCRGVSARSGRRQHAAPLCLTEPPNRLPSPSMQRDRRRRAARYRAHSCGCRDADLGRLAACAVVA
jgi:hypothetical protein